MLELRKILTTSNSLRKTIDFMKDTKLLNQFRASLAEKYDK